MKPYPHQEKSVQEIIKHFESQNRLCFVLPTGGGKTAVFSFLCKYWKKRVLILCHREELIEQTLSTLRTIGVTCESVIASKKRLNHNSQVYVSMVQTLKNRLEADNNFLKDVSLVISDECHLLMHDSIFDYYPNAKILGVTATPTVLKKVNFTRCATCKIEYKEIKICCNKETYEYTRPFTLSEIYEDIITGRSITDLINEGKLVKDLCYSIGGVNRLNFTIDSKTGDFDSKSQDDYFIKKSYDVIKNYNEIANGKKTIIFNSSTKANLQLFEEFEGADNVRMFDSVNCPKNERKPLLKWFKETPNAVLLNCGVFTTGFDEPSVECVILNRSTLSRSLFYQMIGRGGRKCDTIFKPYFTVIDLGGNIEEFGKWSDEIDWKPIFYGTNNKPKPKKEALEQIKECSNCGLLIPKNVISCPECEFEEPKKEFAPKLSGEIAKLIDEIPFPDGYKIVDYAKRLRKDKNFCWKILQSQILDLFYYYNVTDGSFYQSVNNGKFEISIRNIIKSPYMVIQNSDLESGVLRTKAYLVNKIQTELNKYYENRTQI